MKSRENVRGESVNSELITEDSVGLLKELHLLTNQGQLNADARRKLKQVNHLYQLIAPAIHDIASSHDDFQIVDVGAGKAYLGFILYEASLKNLGKGKVLSVEERSDLVTKAKSMASKLRFDRMDFVEGKMESVVLPEKVHLMTALHACDTATDDALIAAVKKEADYIAVVPCCQAEVAQLLKDQKTRPLLELWRHGIHRREFGSHLTNVLRLLVLESLGYQVTVTELVGWEHSLKNEFIFAKRIQRENKMARDRLNEILDTIKVRPKIVRVLCDG